MKALRKGEYDLVNISLIGFDPVTGRSYEECHDEWGAELKRTTAKWESLRWWQWIENIKCRWRFAILHERMGMPI